MTRGHANAALLAAIQRNPAATSDSQLRELLHHILLANRFWLLSILDQPFVLEEASRPAASFDALVQRYARMQAEDAAWLATAAPADIDRVLTNPLIPNRECSVAQALIQVCMHSHGHRAQAAKLLRQHGSAPPATDFILWLTTRTEAQWRITKC